jgi:hypothetical protein
MKTHILFFIAISCGMFLQAGTVEKTFRFQAYTVESKGVYQAVRFENTVLSGLPGEPALPWQTVVMMLPPGESAESVELITSGETAIPGSWLIYPQQPVRPTSDTGFRPLSVNTEVYRQNRAYPADASGRLMTQYLSGYAFALCSFTPVRYNPARKALSYFSEVTVRITTRPDPASLAALKNLPAGLRTAARARSFAMNPAMTEQYPQKDAPATNYQYLVISPASFKTEFQPLISMYAEKGITVRVAATDSIAGVATGYDLQEKIRNYIIGQHQSSGVQYVLLAGNPSLVPARGFYCLVNSGGTPYTDSNIPSDLYYSGIDGTYDANGNHIYGEIADDPDVLPDLSVGRFTVNDTSELRNMIWKTVQYITNPVHGEFSKPLLAGEYLYNNPVTYGGDYMELLIGDRTDNGYFTHGIPPATNVIQKLYDTPSYTWNVPTLIAAINAGTSFIHHLGHANTGYMLRMNMTYITNAYFSQVNGITRNFALLYTQGCYDGAFDQGCIAAKAVSIDNFLVAGVFNSRYGWFNQGTTDGPSEHLEREFVNALYTDTLPEKHIGTAHMISKIETAPYLSLPGEFEPGAQRWCHYCCNVFGDPALEVRTEEPTVFTDITWTGAIDGDWNKAGNWSLGKVPTTLHDVIIPDTPHDPVITTVNTTFCHDITVLSGGNLVISPGKSMVVYGSITMSGGE